MCVASVYLNVNIQKYELKMYSHTKDFVRCSLKGSH